VIVLDASAVLELLLNRASARPVGEYAFAPGETIHVPHVLDLEVAQVLRRYVAAGEIDPARGLQALQDYADLPLVRYPHDIFLLRIWALRHNATAYDAAYLALAEALNAPLVTQDTAMASMPGHRAKVLVV
jgi:predicted nucleic acid-binding protein